MKLPENKEWEDLADIVNKLFIGGTLVVIGSMLLAIVGTGLLWLVIKLNVWMWIVFLFIPLLLIVLMIVHCVKKQE